MAEDVASFSEQQLPATPQQPPPPPPKDINPFGQPATPEANDGSGVDLNASLEPPRPSTPPPPPPVPSRDGGPSSPAPGSPPTSAPPPLPAVGDDVGAAAATVAAAAAVAAGVSSKRKGETQAGRADEVLCTFVDVMGLHHKSAASSGTCLCLQRCSCACALGERWRSLAK